MGRTGGGKSTAACAADDGGLQEEKARCLKRAVKSRGEAEAERGASHG